MISEDVCDNLWEFYTGIIAVIIINFLAPATSMYLAKILKPLCKFDWQIDTPDTERSEVLRCIDHEQKRPISKSYTYELFTYNLELK